MKVTLFDGIYARRCNNIRAVAYGINILIAYSLAPEASVKNIT